MTGYPTDRGCCARMIEINPHVTHIEELRQRADSLRGYL